MLKLLEPPCTEGDIIKHWEYTDCVYVSIICPTFNQSIYIKDAIDSFLSQITQYKFEIIIHDDVSTDDTSTILDQYKRDYPSLIKVITQSENQFSININMPLKHCLGISQGKYIALCEGDDFWLVNNKLQMQIAELEEKTDFNIVISSAFGLFADGTYKKFCDLGKERLYIPFKDCILGPDKDFYPTASFFMRKNILENLPEWFFSAPVSDYYLHVICSYPFGCIYIPEETVVYRRNAVGSLSSLMDKNKFIVLREKSYSCGFKLIEMYKSNHEAKQTLTEKQVEYLFSLFIVSLQSKKMLCASKYIYKSLGVSVFLTLKVFIMRSVKILQQIIIGFVSKLSMGD